MEGMAACSRIRNRERERERQREILCVCVCLWLVCSRPCLCASVRACGFCFVLRHSRVRRRLPLVRDAAAIDRHFTVPAGLYRADRWKHMTTRTHTHSLTHSLTHIHAHTHTHTLSLSPLTVPSPPPPLSAGVVGSPPPPPSTHTPVWSGQQSP